MNSSLTACAYYTSHPKRFREQQAAFERAGVRLLTHHEAQQDPSSIDILIVKTREVGVDLVQKFQSLNKIVVIGEESWMVNLPESKRDIEVCCIPVERGFDVAEHSLLLLLVGLKKFYRLRDVKYRFSLRSVVGLFYNRKASEVRGAHNWTRISGYGLKGKKVGIIGYGLIGRAIHQRLKGFSVEVFYHNSSAYSEEVEQRIAARFLPIDRMFQECDVLFLQLPALPETVGMINKDLLWSAKEGLHLINCGRASVVDREALYEALRRKKVEFYGADVHWREPLPLFDSFRWLKNCIISPHMAEAVEDPKQDLNELILQELTVTG